MKLRILFLLLTSVLAMNAYSQFGVGIRDNRFVYGDFTFKKHYEVRLEQSVFSEKIGYQYLRGYIGYKGSWSSLDYAGRAYIGSAYNRSYYSTGASLKIRYTLLDRVYFDGNLNPHYDSGIGYKTCFYAGAGVNITKEIGFLLGYNTIPEYRMSENRIQAGFDFHISRLSVTPKLSVATSGASKIKTMRVLMNMRYQF